MAEERGFRRMRKGGTLEFDVITSAAMAKGRGQKGLEVQERGEEMAEEE